MTQPALGSSSQPFGPMTLEGSGDSLSVPTKWPNPTREELLKVVNSAYGNAPKLSLRWTYNCNNPRFPERRIFDKPQGIIWDVDGTIANVENFLAHTCWHTLMDFGYEEDMGYLIRLSKEMDPWDYVIEKIREQRPDLQAEDCRDLLRGTERELDEARNHLTVIPDALRKLSRMMPMFIATNRNVDDALSFIEAHRLTDIFGPHNVYGKDADRGIRTKPQADMIQQLAAEHGMNHFIMAGDSHTDLGSLAANARQSGIDLVPVAILRPGNGYDLELERELLAAGAVVCYPTANHLIKDIGRALDLMDGDLGLKRYSDLRAMMQYTPRA